MRPIDRLKLLLDTELFFSPRDTNTGQVFIDFGYTEKFNIGSVDLRPSLHNFIICRFIAADPRLYWFILVDHSPTGRLTFVPTETALEKLPSETRKKLLFHLNLLT